MDDTAHEDAVAEPVPDRVLEVLDHEGPWSEADYRALSAKAVAHGDGRAELVDGALVIGPGPTAAGEQAIGHARAALSGALPDGLSVLGPVALRLGPDCVLVPDLVVMRAPGDPDADAEAVSDTGSDAGADVVADVAADVAVEAKLDVVAGTVVDAAEVLMVVETVGPEHGAMDRSFKPQVYARARVPYLLLVDHFAPFAAAHMVIGGRYHEYARASGTEDLELEEPFHLRLALPQQ